MARTFIACLAVLLLLPPVVTGTSPLGRPAPHTAEVVGSGVGFVDAASFLAVHLCEADRSTAACLSKLRRAIDVSLDAPNGPDRGAGGAFALVNQPANKVSECSRELAFSPNTECARKCDASKDACDGKCTMGFNSCLAQCPALGFACDAYCRAAVIVCRSSCARAHGACVDRCPQGGGRESKRILTDGVLAQ